MVGAFLRGRERAILFYITDNQPVVSRRRVGFFVSIQRCRALQPQFQLFCACFGLGEADSDAQ